MTNAFVGCSGGSDYIESMGDYLKIFTNGKVITTKAKLSDLEKELKTGFLRVHRSYLINIEKIAHFSSDSLNVGKVDIPIGRKYRGVVRAVLAKRQV